MSEAALVLENVRRTFVQAGTQLDVLRGVNMALEPGEMVALVGPSGAGKSTLLHIAGLLEQPDAGDVRIAGESCIHLADDRRTELRRLHLGFVYQYHHLLREFSALENVVLPQMAAGVKRDAARARGHELLASVGLTDRESHRPARLSGGEQQRVALARALANSPKVILADEPTGNLDAQTADSVFDSLVALVRQSGVAALIATHNSDLARRMDRVVALRDGTITAL